MNMFGKCAVSRVCESFSVFICRYTTLHRDLCIGNGPIPFFLAPAVYAVHNNAAKPGGFPAQEASREICCDVCGSYRDVAFYGAGHIGETWGTPLGRFRVSRHHCEPLLTSRCRACRRCHRGRFCGSTRNTTARLRLSFTTARMRWSRH